MSHLSENIKKTTIPFLFSKISLTADDCKEVLSEFFINQDNHTKVKTEYKTSTDLVSKFSERNTNILLSKSINLIYTSLLGALEEYTNLYPELKELVKKWIIDDKFNFQFYNPGEGFHHWHTENIPDRNRLLVWTIYLSSLEDGGTEFSCFNHTEKCIAGKIIIFPADWTFTHRSQISNTGFKFIATGWISIED